MHAYIHSYQRAILTPSVSARTTARPPLAPLLSTWPLPPTPYPEIYLPIDHQIQKKNVYLELAHLRFLLLISTQGKLFLLANDLLSYLLPQPPRYSL